MPHLSRWAKLPLTIATLTTLAAPALAQSFESLPENQQVGYCTTFYLAEQQFSGAAESPIAAGFLALAARMGNLSVADMEPLMMAGAEMVLPSFQTQSSNANSKAMVDMSHTFCAALAENYDETRGLAQ